MLDALTDPHTLFVLRLVLGGLLLFAGVSKLADRASFRDAVAEYDVLPPNAARAFASALPVLEVVLGALLLVGLGTRIAAGFAAPLFLSFALAIGLNMARGRRFDCHCFGSTRSDEIGWPALVRALALVAAATSVAAGASRFGSVEYALFGSSSDLPPVSDVVPMVFVAAVVFDVLFLLPETLALRSAFTRMQAQRHPPSNGHRHSTPVLEVSDIR